MTRIASLRRIMAHPPQYRLWMLFAFIAVVSIPLAVWNYREHQYRRRLAAVTALQRHADSVGVLVDSPNPQASRTLNAWEDVLGRDDVVVNVSCTTSLSDEELSAILCFPKLRVLRLSGSDVTDTQLRDIAALRSIDYLYLDGTSITDEGVSHLGALRSMRILDLGNTKVTGATLDRLSSMTQLETLVLHETQLDDAGVRQLSSQRSVRELDLGQTKISGAAIEDLARMTQLENLRLHKNDIRDAALRPLRDLRNLRILTLGGTQITDAGLSIVAEFKSPQFTQLGLSHCAISDAGLLRLSQLKSLKAVDVFLGTPVTAAGVAELQRLRPDLYIGWKEPSSVWRRKPDKCSIVFN